MARHGDRRGFTAPQRSPQELAETLAELAASAGGPPSKRHRRRPQPDAPSTRGTGRPAPRPTPPTGGGDVSADATTPDLQARAATTPETAREAPAQSPEAPVRSQPARTPAPSRATQTPVSGQPTRSRPRRSPQPDSPAPIVEPPPPADGRRASGLVIGTPLVEASGARLGARPRPADSKSRVPNASSAGTRIRSRAAGPARQRRRLAVGGTGLLSDGPRRLRRPRPRDARTDARSRRLRRLYAPLLLILAAVIILGLVDHGKGHSTKQPGHSGSESRSVFPKPTTIPTVPQTTPAAPAVNTPPSAVTTTAHKNAAAKRASHHAGATRHAGAKHAASHASAHQSSSSSSSVASTPPTDTTSTPASQQTFVPAPPARQPAPPPSHTLGSSGSSLSAGSFVRHHHKKHN